MTASPVGPSGVSGPVDGRSVAEIRADLARCDRDGTPWPGAARRLAADVPVLLAEVEAAHRFEESAAAESAGLANRLNGVAAERDALEAELAAMTRYADAQVRGSMRAAAELSSLRGVVQAARAKLAEPDKWRPYESHDLGEAFLADVVLDWRDDVLAILAAAADAPQPEDGCADCTEAGTKDCTAGCRPSPAQPADPPTKETQR